MKTFRTLALLLLAMCTNHALASGDRAGECVVVSATEYNTTKIVNNCSQRVQIGYCSTERPISGKRCGERANAENPFYTHVTSVEPSTSALIGHPMASLRLAPCMGSMKKFTSGQDGNFSCSNDKAEQLAWAHAVRSTREEACEVARESVKPSERTRAACECRELKQGAVHCKQALSVPLSEVQTRESYIHDIQQWLREQMEGPPRKCPGPGCATTIGVRG